MRYFSRNILSLTEGILFDVSNHPVFESIHAALQKIEQQVGVGSLLFTSVYDGLVGHFRSSQLALSSKYFVNCSFLRISVPILDV
jgi:hypothetical protein